MLNFIGKMVLSKVARELGESFAKAGITGAKVVGRGTIVCEAKVIMQTKEFRDLQASAKQIIQHQKQHR